MLLSRAPTWRLGAGEAQGRTLSGARTPQNPPFVPKAFPGWASYRPPEKSCACAAGRALASRRVREEGVSAYRGPWHPAAAEGHTSRGTPEAARTLMMLLGAERLAG